jgi:hypothetical protein
MWSGWTRTGSEIMIKAENFSENSGQSTRLHYVTLQNTAALKSKLLQDNKRQLKLFYHEKDFVHSNSSVFIISKLHNTILYPRFS